jgi:hydrocephalus-inducing protein
LFKGPLLIGGKNKEVVVLKNLEDVPISFSYDKNSIKGDQETGTSLIIFPLSGTIRPNSEQAIEITFQPQIE